MADSWRRVGGGRGVGAADRALLTCGGEAIPVGATGAQARDLDMDAVGGGLVGGFGPAGDDVAEALVGGDVPPHGDRP